MIRSKLLSFAVFAVLIAGGAAAQPTFSKVFQPDTIGPGSTSRLVFSIGSDQGTPITDLAFTDILPAGVTLATPASPVTTCGGTLTAPSGGGTVSLSGGSLIAFGSCQVQVDVTSSSVGTHMNVSGELTSSAGSSGTAVDDLTVTDDRPGFTKSFSPSTVQLGGGSTLTFTIDNTANPDDAFNLSFSDTLPAGLVVAGPSNATTDCPFGSGAALTATPGSNVVAFQSGSSFIGRQYLPGGASCTVSVDVTAVVSGLQVNRSGTLVAQIDVTGLPTRDSGFAVAALQVNVDSLALVKSFFDDPAAPGGTATLRFSIGNRYRTGSATGIAFTDDLDATLSGLEAVAPLPTNPCGAGSTLTGTSLLTLSGGTLASGATCVFDVTVQVPAGATPGAYPNTTSTVTAMVDGSPVVGSAATDDLVVAPVPLLTKTFLDAGTLMPVTAVAAGDEVVVEFTVTNSSPTAAASGIGFIDNLTDFVPGAVASGLPAAGFCGGGSSLSQVPLPFDTVGLSFANGSLAAGDSCTFQATLQIPVGAASDIYTNTTSEIAATVDAEAVTGPPASADLGVISAPLLTKAFVPAAVEAGAVVTLELTLQRGENIPDPATAIGFTDDLDAALSGLTAISLPANGFCGPSSQISGTSTLTVTGASLGSGESCTFAVTLQVPAGADPGTYTNTTSEVSAMVAGLAVTRPPAEDDLVVLGLVVSKSFVDSPAVAGGTATLTFVLDNTASPFAATDISFTDNLGSVIAGMTATALPSDGFCGMSSQITGPSTLIVSGASVAAGAMCSFSVQVMVPAGTLSGSYPNLTSVIGATVDGNAVALPRASAALAVIDPLSIGKSFIDDPTIPGGTVTLSFTLANASPTDVATALTFTDDVGAALAGMTVIAVPMDGFCGAGSHATGGSVLTVTGANLAAAGQCTFQVTVQVPVAVAPGTTVVNTTSALSGLVGGVAASAPPASDVLRIDLLALAKSFAASVGAGGTVTLSFQITNQGTAVVSGIGFTDDLSATLPGLVAVGLPASGICGVGSSLTGTSQLAFSGGSLAAGASCSFGVTVQVPAAAAPGTYPNTTSSLFVSGEPSGTPASADLVIEPPPLFAKSFSPATLTVGGVSTLTFSVNNGVTPIPATGLAFTDNLPAGLVVAAPPNVINPCGGVVTATPGTGLVSLSGGAVAAVCTLQVDVTAATAGGYVNTSGALTSSLGNSGTATATVTFVEPELVLTKSFLGPAVADGTVDLEFTITNAGAEPVSDITFSDDLDAVIPGLVAVGLPAANVCGTGSQLSGTSLITLTGGNLPAGGFCTFTVTLQLPPDVPGTAVTNVTSPVTFDRGGVILEAAAATAVLEPEVLVIPALSLWGLLLLAALVGVAGWIRLR